MDPEKKGLGVDPKKQDWGTWDVEGGRRERQSREALSSWAQWRQLALHPGGCCLPWGVWRTHLRAGCSRNSRRKYASSSSRSPSIKGSPPRHHFWHFLSCTSSRIVDGVPPLPCGGGWEAAWWQVLHAAQVRFCQVLPTPAGCYSNGWSWKCRQKESNFGHKRKPTHLLIPNSRYFLSRHLISRQVIICFHTDRIRCFERWGFCEKNWPMQCIPII